MTIGSYTITKSKLDPPSGKHLHWWKNHKSIYSVLPGYGWQIVCTMGVWQWIIIKKKGD